MLSGHLSHIRDEERIIFDVRLASGYSLDLKISGQIDQLT
jgi:hypothetical protein